MDAASIRSLEIETTCDVMTDQIAPQVNSCAVFMREIAAQLAELNANLLLLADRQ